MLNPQGPSKIDWTDWTFNPISGCLHGCPYCYMLRMEKRFPGIMLPKFKPEYLERFKHVRKVKSGDKVFVGSSGDMWGEWVPKDWIDSVIDVTRLFPEVTFQFLTKNPVEYYCWELPSNCWLGTTVDGTERTKDNLEYLLASTSSRRIRFVSFEPLLSHVLVPAEQWRQLDWAIIGADSTRGAERPYMWWAESLIFDAIRNGVPVWVKDNYGYPERIKEFPKAREVQP